MPNNLFPTTLFQIVRATWNPPCVIPHMADLESFTNCLPWGSPSNPYRGWLNPQEKERLSSFKHSKRQKEWLAGRICAKAAILNYYQTHLPQQLELSKKRIQITNLESGRPAFLHEQDADLLCKPDISISHSKNYAMAFAARTCCGIDIQHSTEKVLRVKKRFCHDSEEHLLLNLDIKASPALHLTLLWAAKEATIKAVSTSGIPGFLDLKLTGIQKHVQGWLFTFFQNKKQATPAIINVVVGRFEDYGIGICLTENKDAGTARG